MRREESNLEGLLYPSRQDSGWDDLHKCGVVSVKVGDGDDVENHQVYYPWSEGQVSKRDCDKHEE
jgi:hypothetical protein